MEFPTFHEYLQMREGLWMPDNKAIEGLSKLPKPKPMKPAKPRAKPPIKVLPSPKPPKPALRPYPLRPSSDN